MDKYTHTHTHTPPLILFMVLVGVQSEAGRSASVLQEFGSIFTFVLLTDSELWNLVST